MDSAERAQTRGLVRAGAITYALSGLTLVANLAAGIVVARELGAAGRGEVAAILALVYSISWIFSTGSQQAAAYHLARHPADGGRLIGSWLVVLVPLSLAGVAVGVALLPAVFAAQSPEAAELARLFMLVAIPSAVLELGLGVLLGDHDFTFVNLARFASPAGTAVLLALLWQFDALSVETATASYGALVLATAVVVLARAVRRHGIARPSLRLVRVTVWYGFRANGANLGQLLNARLDLIVIPAFLASSSVGLYSVASNVSWIVVTLAGALALIVLPAAARQGERGTRTVVVSLHATLALGALLAAGLVLLASVALRLVYGGEFAGAAESLRILLPGCVLFAAAGVLLSGLNACNRPLTAAVAQGLGLVVTVAGLLLFVQSGGIVAAALVSTASYAVVFVSALLFYKRVAGLVWSDFVPSAVELTFWRGLRSGDRAAAQSDAPA